MTSKTVIVNNVVSVELFGKPEAATYAYTIIRKYSYRLLIKNNGNT